MAMPFCVLVLDIRNFAMVNLTNFSVSAK